MKFTSKYKTFHYENAYEQYHQWNDVHFVQGRWIVNLRTDERLIVFLFLWSYHYLQVILIRYFFILFTVASLVLGDYHFVQDILIYPRHSTNTLTHWGWDKMAATSGMIFSNAFSWMKMYEFWFKFHWSLFPMLQLTIFQYWLRQWLGTNQVTSHHLNQWWLDYWHIYVSIGLKKLIIYTITANWFCNVFCPHFMEHSLFS